MVSGAVTLVRPGDPSYPSGLADLEQPPPMYLMGSLGEEPAVAVVGSRRCTSYGEALARSFGAALAEAGWTTVSGLARGVDAAAHQGCLGAGGRAVAVLGSGVDVCYPRENQSLYTRIVGGGGAVMSEYPPGTPPDRWRFPARNRLLAAISSAVVVVEAAERGGALITARFAAEIGRPVLVVPGDVDRPMSVGCNRLIKDGAHPVLGPLDLVEELSLILGPPRSPPRGPELAATGVEVDDLPRLWGCDPAEAMARLGRMQAEGTVRRVGSRVFPG